MTTTAERSRETILYALDNLDDQTLSGSARFIMRSNALMALRDLVALARRIEKLEEAQA